MQRIEAACLGENGGKGAPSELQKDSVSAPKRVLLEMHSIIFQKLQKAKFQYNKLMQSHAEAIFD